MKNLKVLNFFYGQLFSWKKHKQKHVNTNFIMFSSTRLISVRTETLYLLFAIVPVPSTVLACI